MPRKGPRSSARGKLPGVGALCRARDRLTLAPSDTAFHYITTHGVEARSKATFPDDVIPRRHHQQTPR